MNKTILTYGSIAGVIVSVFMLISMNFFSYCDGKVDLITSMIIGYASMLLAFSLIFVGIQNYRDQYNGGTITFGGAFKVGILIALIASTFYVVAWLIDYFFFMPDFMDKYAARALAELKASGANQATITEKAQEIDGMAKSYQNPIVAALYTYCEIFPVGLLVTLVSAAILKRNTRR